MKPHPIAIAALLALPLGLAWAQPSSGSTPKAKAATVKKSAPSAQAARKSPKQARHTAAAQPASPAPEPAPAAVVHLTDAEMAVAKQIDTGLIACELGAHVTVDADDKNPGFFRVSTGKQHYYMHPVASRTGAIRLEDERAGAVWLQLGNKSMLMNQRLGQRVADDCVSPTQRAVAAQLQAHPQPALFDPPKP